MYLNEIKKSNTYVTKSLKLTKEEILTHNDFSNLSETELLELSEFIYNLSLTLYKMNDHGES